MQHITLTAALSVIAAVSGIWSTGAWDYIGWTTPRAHAADYEQTIEDIKSFRDEWKCDEYDEEVLKLRLQMIDMEREEEDTTEIELLIQKIERKMESLDCSRFEDFG